MSSEYRYFTSDHPVWSFQQLLQKSLIAECAHRIDKWYFRVESVDKSVDWEWPCLLTRISEDFVRSLDYFALEKAGVFADEPATDIARSKYRWTGRHFAMIVPVNERLLLEELVTWVATYFEVVDVAPCPDTTDKEVWLIGGGQALLSELEYWNRKVEVYERLSNFHDFDDAWMDKEAYVRWGRIIGRPRVAATTNTETLLSHDEASDESAVQVSELRIPRASFTTLGIAHTLKIEQVKIKQDASKSVQSAADNATRKAAIPVILRTISEMRDRIGGGTAAQRLDQEIRHLASQFERAKLRKARMKNRDDALTSHDTKRYVVGLRIRTHNANWPQALLPFLQDVKTIDDLVFDVFKIADRETDGSLDIFVVHKDLKDVRDQLYPSYEGHRLVLVGTKPEDSICLDETMGCTAGFDIGAGLYLPVIKKLSEELKKGSDVLPYLRASENNSFKLVALDIKKFKPVDALLDQIAFRIMPDSNMVVSSLLVRTFDQVPVLTAKEHQLEKQLTALEDNLTEADSLMRKLSDPVQRMQEAERKIANLEQQRDALQREVNNLQKRMSGQ